MHFKSTQIEKNGILCSPCLYLAGKDLNFSDPLDPSSWKGVTDQLLIHSKILDLRSNVLDPKSLDLGFQVYLLGSQTCKCTSIVLFYIPKNYYIRVCQIAKSFILHHCTAPHYYINSSKYMYHHQQCITTVLVDDTEK